MVITISPPTDKAFVSTLRALWNVDSRGNRGPAATLSRTDIVEAAIAVADEQGYEALSMRSVATKLGAGTMSLYRHVANRAELVTLMVDHVTAECGDLDPEQTWREQMRQVAWSEWRLWHAHPWMSAAPLSRTAPGPNSARRYDSALAAGLSAGLSPKQAFFGISALLHYVFGAARAALEEAQAVSETGLGIGQWYQAQMDALGDVFSFADYPAMGAVHGSEAGIPGDQEYAVTFTAGLETLLDGIEAQLVGTSAS